jgi:hypothetical protein
VTHPADRRARWRSLLPLAALIPAGIVLQAVASWTPGLVERVYSSGLYPWLSRVMTALTGWFAFSLAEMALIAIGIWVVIVLAATVIQLLLRHRSIRNVLLNGVVKILAATGVIYFSALVLWGLNNHRPTFADSSGLDASPASVVELRAVCEALIEEANALRGQVDVGENGAMRVRGSREDVLERAARGYKDLDRDYAGIDPRLAGRPKEVRGSEVMSYLGISGIYAPFTGEPNVNMEIPDTSLPSAASHEMAHQIGFAREDEANFISYLACRNHPDPDFRYSGVFLALGYALGTLAREDRRAFETLYATVDDGVKLDWKTASEFWAGYDTPIGEISSRVNDAYLKSQGQTAGVKSYGRMVDLLIAEHRKRGSG